MLYRKVLAVGLALLLAAQLAACESDMQGESTAVDWISKGGDAMDTGAYSEARDDFSNAVLQTPEDPQGYRLLLSALDKNGGDTASEIEVYEKLYSLDAFEKKDYLALATLYQQNGESVKARDLLEKAYQLFPEQEVTDALLAAATDIAQEDDPVKSTAEGLFDALQKQDTAAVAGILLAADWYENMMPRLSTGMRRYRGERDGASFRLQVAYGEDGQPSTSLWLLTDGKITYWYSSSVRLVSAALSGTEKECDGPFSSLTINLQDGSVFRDTGTFQDGHLTGDYTSECAYAPQPWDAASLFAAQDGLTYTPYTGTFSQDGTPEAEQQDAAAQAGELVYAYSEQKDTYLYITLPEGLTAENAVFDLAALGIEPWPVW